MAKDGRFFEAIIGDHLMHIYEEKTKEKEIEKNDH